MHSNQFWAACTLWQATENTKWFQMAEAIYKTKIRVADPLKNPTQLYDPVANYVNPTWWGMLCMAQSAPKYSGLEDEATLSVGPPGADVRNNDQYIDFLLTQPFQNGTRGEAMQQIWEQFVYPWITYQADNEPEKRRVKCAACFPNTLCCAVQ